MYITSPNLFDPFIMGFNYFDFILVDEQKSQYSKILIVGNYFAQQHETDKL